MPKPKTTSFGQFDGGKGEAAARKPKVAQKSPRKSASPKRESAGSKGRKMVNQTADELTAYRKKVMRGGM